MTENEIVEKLPIKENSYKYYIGGKGLHIFVSKSGSKIWRMKYYLDKKEQLYTIGQFPNISFEEAFEETKKKKFLAKTLKIKPVKETGVLDVDGNFNAINTIKSLGITGLIIKKVPNGHMVFVPDANSKEDIPI